MYLGDKKKRVKCECSVLSRYAVQDVMVIFPKFLSLPCAVKKSFRTVYVIRRILYFVRNGQTRYSLSPVQEHDFNNINGWICFL